MNQSPRGIVVQVPSTKEMSQAALNPGAILEGLNPAQLHAVTSPAPVVQILAPPGSGKTRTLTARVAFLLASHGFNPSNVIVATFTVKAAREMKERIGKLTGDGLERRLILGTFHSIARRYLVRYGQLIGLGKAFGIADGNDSLAIIKRILKRRKANIDPASARSRISHIKAQGISCDEYVAKNVNSTKRDFAMQEFTVLYREYEEALAQANLLDYDDLLLRCVDLLERHPEVVKNVDVVLVDEFQDTNLVQFELMRGLAQWNKRVTIVGDPDQSIYGFRAAEIKNLTRMRTAYPNTMVVVLEENYRSSSSILQAAQTVIEQDESRHNKMLLPTHSVGTRPVLRYLKDPAQEAQWIVMEVKRVLAMTGHAITPNDIAILVRSWPLTRQIESAMAQNGVAYKVVGGHKFYDKVEVKTVLDYLRVIQNPGNNDALVRVVNVPPRRVGETTVKALIEEGFRGKKTLWEVIKGGIRGEIRLETKITKTAEQGLASFANVIITARKMLFEEENEIFIGGDRLGLNARMEPTQKTTLVDIVYYLMKKLCYGDYLERHYPEDWESRWSNVEELVMQAASYMNDATNNLSEEDDEEALPQIDGIEQQKSSTIVESLDRFLANVSLVSEAQEEEKKEVALREEITISTIHMAKGLEWPVVFIPGCYEGSIPHSRCDDTDEERRLLYVAMTRAMVILYMSCPKKNSKYEASGLSQFIKNPKVLRLLEKKGPSLTPPVVQDILSILGRCYPGLAVIQQGATGLESTEDTLFPTGDSMNRGEEAGDEVLEVNRPITIGTDESGNYSWTKKEEDIGYRNVQRLSTGAGVKGSSGFISARHITRTTINIPYSPEATTMASLASYSTNMTSISGFKSPRGYLRELTDKHPGVEVDTRVERVPPSRVESNMNINEENFEFSARGVSKKIKRNPGKASDKGLVGGQRSLFKLWGGQSGDRNRNWPVIAVKRKQDIVPGRQKGEFVLLSSSPERKSSPCVRVSTPSSLSSFSGSGNHSNKVAIVSSESTSPKLVQSPLSARVLDSDALDDSPSAWPALPQPIIIATACNTPSPKSNYMNTGIDEVDCESEHPTLQDLEPVVPKPLLSRKKNAEFSAAMVTRLVKPSNPQVSSGVVVPEADIAPLFDKATLKAITQQQRPRKTLGVRRSINGWEARKNTTGGKSITGVRKTGAGRGAKGRGFVRNLLG